VARVKIQRVSAGDIAFILGPRLNAAGRLNTALDSLNSAAVRAVSKKPGCSRKTWITRTASARI
jgi:single-stranded DNA-specific DHH superfamily exonuclease